LAVRYKNICLCPEDEKSTLDDHPVKEMNISAGAGSKLDSFANSFQKVPFLQQLPA
jgi:hypothetical protein